MRTPFEAEAGRQFCRIRYPDHGAVIGLWYLARQILNALSMIAP
jgi:hypothetical protein